MYNSILTMLVWMPLQVGVKLSVNCMLTSLRAENLLNLLFSIRNKYPCLVYSLSGFCEWETTWFWVGWSIGQTHTLSELTILLSMYFAFNSSAFIRVSSKFSLVCGEDKVKLLIWMLSTLARSVQPTFWTLCWRSVMYSFASSAISWPKW